MSGRDQQARGPRATFVNVNPSVGWIYRLASFTLGAVNRCSKPHIWPDGKGINSAVVFSRLGGIAKAVLPLGGEAGEYLRHALASSGVDPQILPLDVDTRRTLTFLVSTPELGPQETQVLEPGPPLVPRLQAEFLEMVLNAVEGADAVMFSGSLPPLVPTNYYRQLIQSLRLRSDAQVVVDASGPALKEAVLASPDLLKINLREFEELAQLPPNASSSAILAEMEKLGTQKDISFVVVTRGAEPVLAWSAMSGSFEASPPQVRIENSVGAGDAFAAGFLFRRRLGFEEAVRGGTAAGTASITVVDPAGFDTLDFERLEAKVVMRRRS